MLQNDAVVWLLLFKYAETFGQRHCAFLFWLKYTHTNTNRTIFIFFQRNLIFLWPTLDFYYESQEILFAVFC